MFSLFMHHFAAVAEPMIPAEEPDITKIDSIEDGFGFFRTLGHNSAEWFQREQQNLFAMAIGIGVTLVTVFLVRWFFRGSAAAHHAETAVGAADAYRRAARRAGHVPAAAHRAVDLQ